MTDSIPLCIGYPGMSLLHWQCVWGHCHAEEQNCCNSDSIQMVFQTDQTEVT